MADYRQYPVAPRGGNNANQQTGPLPRQGDGQASPVNNQASHDAVSAYQAGQVRRFEEAQQRGQVHVTPPEAAATSQAAAAAASAAKPSQAAVSGTSPKTASGVRPVDPKKAPSGASGKGGSYVRYPQGALAGEDDKKSRKKGSLFWRVAFIAALSVFVVSLVALGVIGYGYLTGRNVYNDVASSGFIPPEDVAGSGGDTTPLSLADLKVNWDDLLAKNPDTVAWIYIPGTVVNYPIVQTTDNVKYLTVDFLGGKGQVVTFGTIFQAAENSPGFTDPNNIIYGHHMNDGSMFACIDGFRTQDAFDSHRTIYILTPQGNYRLETFALVICDGNDTLAQPRFASTDEMTQYFQDKIDRSIVTPSSDPIVAAGITKAFALITCDYSVNDGRAVLYASVVESTVPSTSADQQGTTDVNQGDLTNIDNAEEGLK
ncbi:MAG: class B sortase [Eggerthellaceae bacterium]|nr:class B sortase [Eggerthellaceae bacterium]